MPPSRRQSASGCGNRKLFRCAYHGWTYRLDGALLVTPEFEGVEDFDPAEFGLVPVRIEEWLQSYLRQSRWRGSSFARLSRRIAAQAEKFDFSSMKFSERRTYEMNCNWKTYIDNYLEAITYPSRPPSLNREINYSAYTVEPHANYVRQWTRFEAAQSGDAAPVATSTAGADLTARLFLDFSQLDAQLLPR